MRACPMGASAHVGASSPAAAVAADAGPGHGCTRAQPAAIDDAPPPARRLTTILEYVTTVLTLRGSCVVLLDLDLCSISTFFSILI